MDTESRFLAGSFMAFLVCLTILCAQCAGDAYGPSDALEAVPQLDARTYDGQCDDLWPGRPLAAIQVGDPASDHGTISPSDYEAIHYQCRYNSGCGYAEETPCGYGDHMDCILCYAHTCIRAEWEHECDPGPDE